MNMLYVRKRRCLEIDCEDAKGVVKLLSSCWCWALDLHVLVGDGADAGVILAKMVARKDVLLSIFSKMRKIAYRT